MNNNEIYCSKTTFSKYAIILSYIKRKIKKPKRKNRIKANKIFEWLHVDITYINTIQNGKQKVAFVKNNYNKCILHYKTTNGEAGSKFIKNLFQETFKKYNLYNERSPINILSHGGSEN